MPRSASRSSTRRAPQATALGAPTPALPASPATRTPRAETLVLQARVDRSRPPFLASQAEFAGAFGVSDQTLRNWSARGMPTVRSADGRPKYSPDAYVWAMEWLVQQRVAQELRREPPRRLDMATVQRDLLLEALAEDPEAFVVVPLEPDHPERAESLTRAAAGAAGGR